MQETHPDAGHVPEGRELRLSHTLSDRRSCRERVLLREKRCYILFMSFSASDFTSSWLL